MWNEVNQTIPNNKRYDKTKTLPFRGRLIIVYEYRAVKRTGEAYIHDGEWYWWFDETPINSMEYKIFCWTEFPTSVFTQG